MSDRGAWAAVAIGAGIGVLALASKKGSRGGFQSDGSFKLSSAQQKRALELKKKLEAEQRRKK